MNHRTKYTTLALNENQYLTAKYKYSEEEIYCIGHTGGERDRSLDGHYQTKGLKIKKQTKS